ncbi:hypothetical protein ABBQ38_008868 [Trebouxia sp. C0009 RCD-2024]
MYFPRAQARLFLESGTGSGSLTHSLARAVAPTGHVHTFEFHQPRAEAADKEFKEHGMGDVITTQQRNIEELGFPEELHGAADGVFLDLPRPWQAVASAAQCLRPDGVFCSFSPCIEQVQRTCAALEEQGFFAVRTMECLLRQYEVRQEKFTALGDDLQGPQHQQLTGKRKRQENFQSRKRQAATAPTGASNQATTTQHPTANPSEAAAAQQLDGHLTQPVQHKADAAVNAVGASTPSSPDQSTMPTAHQQTNSTAPSNLPQPQLQDEGPPGPGTNAISPAGGIAPSPFPASQTEVQAGRLPNGPGTAVGLQEPAKGSRQEQPAPQRCVVAKPVNDARGHTGYLTFARRSVDD